MKYVALTILVLSLGNFAEAKNLRRVSFIIDEFGIYPNSMSAFVGEELEVYVTSTSKKSCVMVEGYQMFLSANKGKVSEGKIKLDKSGSFKIYCPSDKFQANITVLDNKRNRNIASSQDAEPSVWVPKDYSE